VIRVEPFDVRSADAATVDAYARMAVAGALEWAPRGYPPPAAHLLLELREAPANETKHVFLAYSGDEVVGAADVMWWEAPDNRDRAWLHLDVATFDASVVAALTSRAAAVATSVGRPLLTAESPADSPLSAWVKARGASFGSLEETNVVRLGGLDRDDVAALAAARPEGYELVAFDGPAPDDVVEAYVDLNNCMNDAPRDALTMEDWSFTVDRLRVWEAGVRARGHDVWTVVARQTATGELGGYNQLILRPEWPEVVENEDTGVTRAHRGHGLGLWLKSVNLLRVLDERPEAACVQTWNAASNEHMLRVNHRLGFACEHRWEMWEIPAAALETEAP
jgi:GNAT superfamily N-acetyltransferase